MGRSIELVVETARHDGDTNGACLSSSSPSLPTSCSSSLHRAPAKWVSSWQRTSNVPLEPYYQGVFLRLFPAHFVGSLLKYELALAWIGHGKCCLPTFQLNPF